AGLRGRLLVVFLAEGHDVDGVLTQGRADGRRRRGLARVQLDSDDGSDFLCHLFSRFCVGSRRSSRASLGLVRPYRRSTWRKSSSTGVSRPKKETRTRTLPLSRSMESTTPTKSTKGPSTMRTL